MKKEQTVNIPERTELLEAVSAYPGLSFDQLVARIATSKEQVIPIQRRLYAMIRDGQLYINDNCLKVEDRQQVGKVTKLPSGKGFVDFPAGETSWFLPEEQARYCMNGEVVEVVPDHETAKGVTARLIKVIDSSESLMGHIEQRKDGSCRFHSVNKTDSVQLVVPEGQEFTGWGFASLLPTDDRKSRKLMSFEQIESPSPLEELRGSCLNKHGFVAQHDKDTEREALARAADATHSENDFTVLPLVTIDGASSRDRDDAIYARQVDNGDWHVFVAIADVSRYVLPGSTLDESAFKNATSVYTQGHAFPMLPSLLSNEICSLNPHVKRDALMLQLVLDHEGNEKSSQFFEATVSSHAAYSYARAQALIDGDLPNESEKSTVHVLKSAHKLWQILHKKRQERGVVEFEKDEHGINIINDNVDGFFLLRTYETHRLIEEFMVLANNAAANFILNHYGYGLFRHHPGLKESSLPELNDMLCTYEVAVTLTTDSTSTDCSNARAGLPEEVQDEFDRKLRTAMTPACYDSKNSYHFGLSLDKYTHFTSPIRRYPDLAVHRMIKQALSQQHFSTTGEHFYTEEALQELCKHCSERSYAAAKVERDVFDGLSAMWWSKNEGKVTEAVIVGFNERFVFFRLGETPAQGSCSASLLHDNPTPGERISVRVVKADIENGRIHVHPHATEEKLPF